MFHFQRVFLNNILMIIRILMDYEHRQTQFALDKYFVHHHCYEAHSHTVTHLTTE